MGSAQLGCPLPLPAPAPAALSAFACIALLTAKPAAAGVVTISCLPKCVRCAYVRPPPCAVQASSLRPLFDLLGAQAGDVLHLQYTGYKDRAVQVRASLAARPGAKAAAAAGGGSMLQSGRQQAGAAASGAELEAAADLLGMWQGQAEGLLPADGTRAGTPSLSASPPGSFGHRKRTQAEDFSSGSSGSSEQPVAKRRVLECGGSDAGFAAPGLQPLQAHQGHPPPLQQPESGPEPQQQQQQQQPQEEGSIARVQQALGSHFGHRRDGGCREQHAVPAQLEEHTPQPAPTAPGTNPAGSHGTASAAPGTADSVQQASALLAAALRADERRRPGQQVRAVMETLRLMGVERTLRKVRRPAGVAPTWYRLHSSLCEAACGCA